MITLFIQQFKTEAINRKQRREQAELWRQSTIDTELFNKATKGVKMENWGGLKSYRNILH